MKAEDKDRIQNAIRHIQTATDVDPWAAEIAVEALEKQLSNHSEIPNSSDLISRQAAIAEFSCCELTPDGGIDANYAIDFLKCMPSEQPGRRCVNCGRTVNNGGWYEDGRTRCPIEEHYALPKDGYCYLWEKKKVWEDDYVKRPEEGEK